MPRRAASQTKYLFKRHHGCRNVDPTRCACQWRVRYKGHDVLLSDWVKQTVDPHTKAEAIKIRNRIIAAIDNDNFDPAGERPVTGSDEDTLATLITMWRVGYAERYELSMDSLDDVLNVLSTSKLGGLTLETFAMATTEIEDWLEVTGKARKWGNKTWNDYRDLLCRLAKYGVARKTADGKHPLLAMNPITAIDRKVADEPEHFKTRHLVEDVEATLFEVVGQLNRPLHVATRSKLTRAKVNAIRLQLAAGTPGVVIAKTFHISPAVVSSIKHGDIWKETTKIGTRGTEMERRLIIAFDTGLRAGEMLSIRSTDVKLIDGVYEITLQPHQTKGGKSTGKVERVYAATPRAVKMIQARLFQLRANKAERQYLFGTEDGRRLKGFKRAWHDLFTLAKLDFGRDKGLVWHTVRHEFISRLVENKVDPVVIKETARHQSLETTEGYMHARRDRRIAAFASLGRK